MFRLAQQTTLSEKRYQNEQYYHNNIYSKRCNILVGKTIDCLQKAVA